MQNKLAQAVWLTYFSIYWITLPVENPAIVTKNFRDCPQFLQKKIRDNTYFSIYHMPVVRYFDPVWLFWQFHEVNHKCTCLILHHQLHLPGLRVKVMRSSSACTCYVWSPHLILFVCSIAGPNGVLLQIVKLLSTQFFSHNLNIPQYKRIPLMLATP